MDAKQYWSDHYNVHSLYGFSETEPTLMLVFYAFLLKLPKIILLINRLSYLNSKL